MSIQEAHKEMKTKLRKPQWNPTAYLELRIQGFYLAPWATLHDLGETQPVMILGDTSKDWEPFEDTPPTT